MQSKTDFDTWNTSVSTKKITVGFQPKLVIFFTTPDTTLVPPQSEFFHCIGFATMSSQDLNGDGSNNFCLVNLAAQDDQLTVHPTKSRQQTRVDGAMYLGTWVDGDIGVARVLSFDADGFTLSFDVPPPAAYHFAYLAIGGSEITNTFIGTAELQENSTIITTRTVTGIPFDPDFVIIGTDYIVPPATAVVSVNNFGLLFPQKRRSLFTPAANFPQNGVGLSYMQHIDWSHMSAAIDNRAIFDQISSFTIGFHDYLSGGFSVNVQGSSGGSSKRTIYYVAIEGPTLEIGGLYQERFNTSQPNTDILFTIPNVPNPMAMFSMYQRNGDIFTPGDAGTVQQHNTGDIFLDGQGKMANTGRYYHQPFDGTGNNAHRSVDAFTAWKIYEERTDSLWSDSSFVQWIPGVTNGQLKLHVGVDTPVTNTTTGESFGALFFGGKPEQIVGQLGMIV